MRNTITFRRFFLVSTVLLGSWNLEPETLSAQYTGIPDPNFEQALIDLGIDSDGTVDGQVLTSDIVGVEELDVSGDWGDPSNIDDLTGIEDFAALKELNISINNLTTLDMSNNSNLLVLDAWGNQLTTLNISNNNPLEELVLSGGPSTLDLSNNGNLKLLIYRFSNLTTLDISNNPLLEHLDISNNTISNLDFTNNTNLKILKYAANSLSSLDISNNTLLEDLDISYNSLTNIDLSNNGNLKRLEAIDHYFDDIDLSNNPELEYLDLSSYNSWSSELSELDVTNNVLLKELYFLGPDYLSGGPLTFLDLSNNSELETVHVINHPNLIRVDLKNGNNANMVDVEFFCMIEEWTCDSPCVEVDDVTAATNGEYPYNQWYVGAFSEDCTLSDVSFGLIELSIYPNPARSYLSLQTEEPLHYQLYSILGQALMSGTLPQGDNQLDIRGLSSGVYILQLDNGVGQKKMEKVVIER